MSRVNRNRNQQGAVSSGGTAPASQPPSFDPTAFLQDPTANPTPYIQDWNSQQQADDQNPYINTVHQAPTGHGTPLSPIHLPSDPSIPGPFGQGFDLTGNIGEGLVQPRPENRHPQTYDLVRNRLFGADLAPTNFLAATQFRLQGQPLWGQSASPFVPGAAQEDVPQNATAARDFFDTRILWRPSSQLDGVPHPLDGERIRGYGNAIANAIADLQSAEDKIANASHFKRFLPLEEGGVWSWQYVTAVAHHIVGLAIRMHEQGTGNSAFLDPEIVPTGVDVTLNFHDRMAAFANLLRNFKSCADSMMHQNCIEQYLANPVRTLEVQNRRLNEWNRRLHQRHQQSTQQRNEPAGNPPSVPSMAHLSTRGSRNVPAARRQRHSITSPSLHPASIRFDGSSHTSGDANLGTIDFNLYTGHASSSFHRQSPFASPQDPHLTNPYYDAGYRPTGSETRSQSVQPRQPTAIPPLHVAHSGMDHTTSGGSFSSFRVEQAPQPSLHQDSVTESSPAGLAAIPRAPSRPIPVPFDYNLHFLRASAEQVPTAMPEQQWLQQYQAQYEQQLGQQQQQDQFEDRENQEEATDS